MKGSIARCTAALATLMAVGPALAADVPARTAKAPVFVPVPAYHSWSGFYVGASAGGAWGRSSWTDSVMPTGRFDVSGAVVGGTVGFNMQLNQLVFGVEGDMSWTNINGGTTANCRFGCETGNGWLGTGRGRIGYAFDRFMPYMTGGFAAGDVRAHGLAIPGAENTQTGWTLGGGLEHALAQHWSVKAEYLYVDLGKFDCGFSCGATQPPDNVEFRTHVLRGGVNYKF